jgi:hypothetical protein
MGPIFDFDLGIGDGQEIHFEMGIRIDQKAIVRSGTGDDERYGAKVFFDLHGSVVNGGLYTQRIATNEYIMPRAPSLNHEGFSVDFRSRVRKTVSRFLSGSDAR